jgi:DivIVA domain-containing protein
MANDFVVVLRGYDRVQVDAALAEASKLRDSGQTEAARQLLSGKRFDVRLRGYDRGQVDAHLEALARQ